MDALLLHHTHLFCMCAIVCCMGCKQDASICFTWGLLSLIASGTNASGWSDFKDLPGAGNCNHSDYQFGLVCWASCLDRLFLPALVPLLRSCLMFSEHTHARTHTRTHTHTHSLSLSRDLACAVGNGLLRVLHVVRLWRVCRHPKPTGNILLHHKCVTAC